jgi:hypothetical protein
MRALQNAVEQQHAIPPNKIAKFLIAGENLTVSSTKLRALASTEFMLQLLRCFSPTPSQPRYTRA